MDYSLRFDIINLQCSIVYIKGSKVIFPNKIVHVFPSLMILFFLISIDPDEIPQFATFRPFAKVQ